MSKSSLSTSPSSATPGKTTRRSPTPRFSMPRASGRWGCRPLSLSKLPAGFENAPGRKRCVWKRGACAQKQSASSPRHSNRICFHRLSRAMASPASAFCCRLRRPLSRPRSSSAWICTRSLISIAWRPSRLPRRCTLTARATIRSTSAKHESVCGHPCRTGTGRYAVNEFNPRGCRYSGAVANVALDRAAPLSQSQLDGAYFNLHFASDTGNVPRVPGKSKAKHRSGCPVSISLEIVGDRWSLLIIRDLMIRGFRTFKEFQESGEGIATNILADRLDKLEAAGIITGLAEETDGRRVNYRLTEKGIGLAPVLLELLIWGARHEETGAPCALIENMEKNRQVLLAEVRRRWRERDPTPLQVEGQWRWP